MCVGTLRRTRSPRLCTILRIPALPPRRRILQPGRLHGRNFTLQGRSTGGRLYPRFGTNGSPCIIAYQRSINCLTGYIAGYLKPRSGLYITSEQYKNHIATWLAMHFFSLASGKSRRTHELCRVAKPAQHAGQQGPRAVLPVTQPGADRRLRQSEQRPVCIMQPLLSQHR